MNFSIIILRLMPALFFFGLLNPVMSQPSNNIVNDVVMPAPNAASLGKYGDIPVSTYTGVPNISVPIYSVQEGPLLLPLSLNYHASGVKVGEMASWVGMGWSLSAGGMITRTVQGHPDERSPYGYYHYGANLSNSALETQMIVNGEALDSEPDMFSISLPGYSGKFYIDKDHNFQLVPKQDLIIKWKGTFDQFTVIAPDGTKYIFGEDPTNGILMVDKKLMIDNPFEITSSWHLVRVESHDGNYHIDFNYVDEHYGYRNLASCWYEQFACSGTNGPQNSIDCSSTTSVIDDNHRTIKSSISGKRLSSITCSTSTIDFYAGILREDLENHINYNNSAKQLDSIEITSGAFCSKFILSYDYFQDLRSLNSFPLYNLSESKRLKLLSVQEMACDNSIDKPPYTFTYEGETVTQEIEGGSVTRQFIPHRLSKEIDHWGYYNAHHGNEYLFVNVPPTTIQISGGNTVTYGDANRDPNEDAMKKGVLTKIDYPTGGHTIFEYEANDYNSTEIEYDFLFDLKNYPYPDPNQVCGQTEVETVHTFTQSELDDAVYSLSLVYPGQGCPNVGPTISMSVTAYNDNTGDFLGYVSINITPTPGNTVITPYEPLNPFGIGTIPANTPIKFVLHALDGWAKFEVSLANEVNTNVDAGGLRVKSITIHDGINSSNDIIRTYEYTDENDASKSSGVVMDYPLYGIFNLQPPATPSAPAITDHFIFNSEAQVPLGGFDGVEIGYKHVIEHENGNGSTSYSYYVDELNHINYLQLYGLLFYPIAPPQLVTTINGKLNKSEQFKEGGTKVSSEKNNGIDAFESLSQGTIYKYVTRPITLCDPNPQQGQVNLFFKTIYSIRSSIFRLISTETTLEGVTNNTTFKYNQNNDHYFPIEETFTNSDGKVHKTEYFYPHDIGTNNTPSISSGVVDCMIEKNMVGTPIQVINWVDGEEVSGTYTIYDIFEGSSSDCESVKIYPAEYYPWEGGWNPTSKTTVLAYQDGYPSEIQKYGWGIEKFFWENGLLIHKQYEDFHWDWQYYPNTRFLQLFTDIDGQQTSYSYDQLFRLNGVVERNNEITTTLNYTLDLLSEGNFIHTLVDFNDGLRWSNKSGHTNKLNLCSYEESKWTKKASTV